MLKKADSEKQVESVNTNKKITAKAKEKESSIDKKVTSKKIAVDSKEEKDNKNVTKKTYKEYDVKNRYTSNNLKRNFENNYKEKALEIEKNILSKVSANSTKNPEKYLKLVNVNKLLEIGSHIGLPPKRWNPKMKSYIYAKKGRNYIIDLAQTVILLNEAYDFLLDLSKKGGLSLIVGTRGDIIKEHVKEESKRSSSFYINERWLGGTLTNFKTINNSIKKFNNLLVMQKFGEIDKYNKKEKVEIKKETQKLAKFFGGIRMMKDIPQVLILTDPENEKNALLEAKKLSIPIIAICNTNANPEGIDFVIPANNYSIKTVYLIIGILVDAICEGKTIPTKFAYKNADDIIFPEVVKKKPEYVRVVNHRNYSNNRY